MATERNRETNAGKSTDRTTGTPRVRWDDSRMQSTYANVTNVASTREEVVLLFGMNQVWHATQKEIAVQLTNRIIVSPFVAKRLQIMLGNVLREYEARFGEISIDGRRGGK
jgi:hypothetical protein